MYILVTVTSNFPFLALKDKRFSVGVFFGWCFKGYATGEKRKKIGWFLLESRKVTCLALLPQTIGFKTRVTFSSIQK